MSFEDKEKDTNRNARPATTNAESSAPAPSKIICGDCEQVLKTFPENSVDAIVCDPPYGFSFMNRAWDYQVPKVDVWREALRVLKPGGHLLAFGGPRTYHRLAVNIEDAGFEIRDQIMWLFGSGFPKSHNIEKATGDSKYAGLGTALKPAHEPIVLARKPIAEKTVASNVVKYGTGGINVDACRVETNGDTSNKRTCTRVMGVGIPQSAGAIQEGFDYHAQGRFPANLILSHSEHCTDERCDMFCPVHLLDEQHGPTTGGGKTKVKTDATQMFGMKGHVNVDYADHGGPSRFFYCSKVSKAERNAGLEGMPNTHPTLKPQKIMQYLIKLITPPGGVVLDPFMGSGSTGVACKTLGFEFIGIEREAEYVEIAERRISL